MTWYVIQQIPDLPGQRRKPPLPANFKGWRDDFWEAWEFGKTLNISYTVVTVHKHPLDILLGRD